ncbi:MAG: hypothetical protein EA409_06340 [Saprospirales bacterium]|nr:MAG: hypothetical protein EA409_06340 [Saprospirales bacterium]
MNAEEIARKKVKQKKKFYKKLSGHTTAIVILVAVNWLFTPSFWWSVIPISVLVIELVVNYLKAFGFGGQSPDWEYRAYQKELKRLRKLTGEEGARSDQESSDKLDLEELKRKTHEKQKTWDERDLV